jgi:transcriptional regulator with XRE-family HTH domain
MSRPAQRIKPALSDKRMRAADLSRITGATKGAVSQWVNGIASPSGEYLLKAAVALGVTPDWLLNGADIPRHDPSNVGLASAVRGMVPLISWVQVGSMAEVVELYAPGDGDLRRCRSRRGTAVAWWREIVRCGRHLRSILKTADGAILGRSIRSTRSLRLLAS